ncbi:MAG: sigma-70 family RNA polymerase sigma factor [Streptosporangiaceae bacterium]
MTPRLSREIASDRGRVADLAVLEDAALVERLAEGDPDALGTLYQRHGSACYRLARQITVSVTLAEDAVQEAFVGLWKAPGSYLRDRGSVRSWLLGLTHHKAVDLVRRETAEQRRQAAQAAQQLISPQPGQDPASAAWAEIQAAEVRSALLELPDAQRRALTLAYFGGYTQSQIAEFTGAPLGTVKTRMFTAKPVRRLSGAAFLDTAALALTATEVAQVWQQRLGWHAADHDVRYLLEVTGGRATAVVLAVPVLGAPVPGAPGRAVRGGAGAALPAGPDVITALTGAMLEALTPAERAVVAQLAHLPWLSPELVDDIAGTAGMFDRLVAVGIPLVRTQTGWWEMPSPVGACLTARAGLSPAAAAVAARAYARGADVLNAARVLLAAGSPEQAAKVLAGVSPEAVEDIGWAQFRDLVEMLPEAAVAAHPQVLVHLARTAETAHRLDSRRSALERARAITAAPGGRGQDGLVRELDAEWARYLMWDDRTRAEAPQLARAVLEQAGDGEIIARIRALDVLGRLGCALFSAEGTTAEAERFLAEAARLARRIGQRTWAAQALVPLATTIYHERCQFGRALATLDQALAVLPARGQYRALALSFRCDVLAGIGRYREAAAGLAEARAIGRAAGEEWALALASWGETLLASVAGDRDGTVRAVRDTEAHRDPWFDQSEGVEWLANAADALDRVGEHEMARERLAAARQRMRDTSGRSSCSRPPCSGGRAIRTGPRQRSRPAWPGLT